jgi:hypothetical protein
MAIAVYPDTPKVFHKDKSVSEAAPTPINPLLHRHFVLVRQVPGHLDLDHPMLDIRPLPP